MAMKIALLTHQFPGVRGGGIGTYILQAACALAAAGHEPHIFTPPLPSDVKAQLSPAVALHETKELAEVMADSQMPPALAEEITAGRGGEATHRLGLAWSLCNALKIFHEQHPLDIVEAPEYEALALPLLLNPVPNLPVVTHLHLCSAIAREGNAGTAQPASDDDARIDALEAAAITLADGICSPTRWLVAETSRHAGELPHVDIIPYPMNIPAAPQPLPEDGPILFVGRLEARKGSDLMPGAFSRFLARNPDATIRLVGSDTQTPATAAGPGESVRARLVQRLLPELRPRVIFAGEKSPAQVREEFTACRFSIVPSLFENFPYVAVESLAAGRPVIAGDATGTVEVVGDAGLAFSRGNAEEFAGAMEQLWRDHQLCARLAEKARLRAAQLFSLENTITARINFYQRAIEHRRTSKVRSSRFSVSSPPPSPALLEAIALLSNHAAPLPPINPNSPGARLLHILNQIAPQGGAKVHLYGAGRFTSRLLTQRRLWESRGHLIVGLIDDHPRFATNPAHLGFPVQSVQAAQQSLTSADHVILSTDTFEDQFWDQAAGLCHAGICVHRLREPLDFDANETYTL
jgi:glycosyltransferase involved in cell wall biosynthesis